MSKKKHQYLKRVRIFIGSPSDLGDERRFFPEVIEKVNKIKAKAAGVILEPVSWEDTIPGKVRPQARINEDLVACEIVVLMLWKRWGSPTSTDKHYKSGFEEEYELANKEGKDIWFYFRSIPEILLEDPGQQLNHVLTFRDKTETEKRYFFYQYDSPDKWAKVFEQHLCGWIDKIPPLTIDIDLLIEKVNRIEILDRQLQQYTEEFVRLADNYTDMAIEYTNAGRLTRAEECFVKALAISQTPYSVNSYGNFLLSIGFYKRSEQQYRKLANIGEEIGDKRSQLAAYGNLGALYGIIEDFKKSKLMFEMSLKIARDLNDSRGIANAYANLGNVMGSLGNFEKAEEMYKLSLQIFRELGYANDVSGCLSMLGMTYYERNDYDKAESILVEAIKVGKEGKDKVGLIVSYGNLGTIYYVKDRLKESERMYTKALKLSEELGKKLEIAISLENLGGVAIKLKENPKAIQLFKKSLSIYLELGIGSLIEKVRKELKYLGQ